MVRVLEEIRSVISMPIKTDGDADEEGRRKELAAALFSEILERVGDREKDAAMRWWYTHRTSFLLGDDSDAMTKQRGNGKDRAPSDIASRL